jgi:hypothetical protein
MKTIKYITLVVLAALTLGLAAATEPIIAGGKKGVAPGNTNTPPHITIAGAKKGIRPGATLGVPEPGPIVTIAGGKKGVAPGTKEPIVIIAGRKKGISPRITIAGSYTIRLGQEPARTRYE